MNEEVSLESAIIRAGWNEEHKEALFAELRYLRAVQVSSLPPMEDIAGQKYPRGTRVNVAPNTCYLYRDGFEAIVEYTYAQKYWGDDVKSYGVVVLEDGEPVNRASWMPEGGLALVSNDLEAGKALIGRYYEARRRSGQGE